MGDRQVLALPIYIVVEEDALIMPNVTVEIVTPSQLPIDGSFLALTKDGLQISKDTKIVKALVDAKAACGDEFLADVKSVPKMRLPKIGPLVTARAWRFFKKVYDKYQTESELMLLYNRDEKRYDLWCPKQEVSAAGVNYNMSDELANTPPEWQWVGTYHSHANFSAYHSHVDHMDEQHEDGVHITIGHVNLQSCSISASVMIGGSRWLLPSENILLGIMRTDDRKTYFINTKDENSSFQVQLSDEELKIFKAECESQIEEEWFPRVKHKIYKQYVGYGKFHQQHYYEWDEEPDLNEDEEGGEWQLVNGHWKFVEDEPEENEFDPADFSTYHDPNGINSTETEKDAAIAADANVEESDSDDDDGQTDG